MAITVNGEAQELDAPLTVTDLITARGLNPLRVAVELNGEIVPRSERDTRQITDGDTLEVVSFVQGG